MLVASFLTVVTAITVTVVSTAVVSTVSVSTVSVSTSIISVPCVSGGIGISLGFGISGPLAQVVTSESGIGTKTVSVSVSESAIGAKTVSVSGMAVVSTKTISTIGTKTVSVSGVSKVAGVQDSGFSISLGFGISGPLAQVVSVSTAVVSAVS